MKKSKSIAGGIFLFFFLISGISAQTNATWKGGTPGRNNDWNCPTNWKENRIPDEFSQVIIPGDCIYYPVIKANVAPVDALMVESGAIVTIDKDAVLTIIGATGRLSGVSLFGRIINKGLVQYEFRPGKSDQVIPQDNEIVQY